MIEAQLVLFDYNALDTDTRAFVEARTVEIKALVRRSAQDVVSIGCYLEEVKDRLGHGYFGKWLEAEFDWTQQTANNFMRVAAKFKNFLNIDGFGPSALYLLSAPSTPDDAFEDAIERAENGERITYSTAKDIVSQHKDAALTPAAEWQAPPQYADLKAKLIEDNRAVFVCPTCNDIFDNEVWHCRTCGHHWPMSRDTCHNCYEPRVRANGYPLTAANHAVSTDPDYDGDEWYTPTEYIEAARIVMGQIDLDPASCEAAQRIVQAAAYLTKEDDALRDGIEWRGRVWLNPPYSTPLIRHFVSKLIQQYEIGNITEAIIITNNSSDTGWFHDLLSRYPACFTRGRAQFWRPDSAAFGARQGQTIFYLGDDFEAFRFVFDAFGQVVRKA